MTFAAAVLLAARASTVGSVVVFPPEGPAADAAWVSVAVADLLPRDLALLGVAAVERGDRLRAQETLAVPTNPLTRASSIRIGEALGASRLVVGSRDTDGRNLTLSLRVLDVERGTLSAPFRASGALTQLAEMIHGLAFDIALSGPTPPSRRRDDFLAARQAVPFEALQAYAQGLAGADEASRIKLVKRSLTLFPGFDEARIGLGRLHLEARDHGAAQEALARVPPASPFARTARFLQGIAWLELGRYREAAGLYAALAAEDPTAAVLNNYAIALLRLGGAGAVKASDVLRKAAEMQPGYPDLPFNLGWALLSEGDAEAAAFWISGVTRQWPGDVRARLVLAWALRQAGRSDAADEEWRGLIAVAPSYASAATPDFSRHFERILPSELTLALDQEGRSDSELAAVHLGRAEKLRAAGDAEGAVSELTQAVYLDPHGARGHLLLARAHRSRGDKEKAVNELRVSLWCRDESAVRLELSGLLKELGREPEAKAEAEKALKLDPANAARVPIEKP